MLADRSGEVFGRTMGEGLAGAKDGNAEVGSTFSAEGVDFVELSLELPNQKSFFLLEGLAELVDRLGDPEADAGLLAKTSSPEGALLFAKFDGLGVAASAVLGRLLGLPSSLPRTKVGADCAGGLAAANELTLPVSE